MRRAVSRPPVEDDPGVVKVVGVKLILVMGVNMLAVAAGSCSLPQAGWVPLAIALLEVPGVAVLPLPPACAVGVTEAVPLLASIVGVAVICHVGPPSEVRA